jgi:tRNA 2-thiouridine synthesizing protein A
MQADKNLKATGLACISLTPEIKKAMSGMQSNEVLEVLSDDPASREGIPAWCRLTGHQLVETKEISSEETAFYIQKK